MYDLVHLQNHRDHKLTSPLAINPLPKPVPNVIITKSSTPLAAPYIRSPSAAALASFVKVVGKFKRSSNNLAKGIIKAFQFKFGANSILPEKSYR